MSKKERGNGCSISFFLTKDLSPTELFLGLLKTRVQTEHGRAKKGFPWLVVSRKSNFFSMFRLEHRETTRY